MKKIFIIGLMVLSVLSFSSCKDWLDVNSNIDTPSSKVVKPDLRLLAMTHYLEYAYETAGMRSSFITQTITRDYVSGNAHSQLSGWAPLQGSSATLQQQLMVGCLSNVDDLIASAESEEAWHYVGAAYFIKAWGFKTLLDWFGEYPMSQALGESIIPTYDTGEQIYNQCQELMDKAIEYLSKEQPVSATPLSSGDSHWMGGDNTKWIKAAYGFKARWLNECSKKSQYYDADQILTWLDKAAQSNGDSFVSTHMNTTDDTDRNMLSDPTMTSVLFDNIGMNAYPRLCKYYTDLLENMRNSGVEDPRANKLIPMGEFNIDGTLTLMRSKGVDMLSDIRVNGQGPVLFTLKNHFQVTDPADPDGKRIIKTGWGWFNQANMLGQRSGDSVYLAMRSRGAYRYALKDNEDDTWTETVENSEGVPVERIENTGTFYTRPGAPSHYMAYPELCFIKAEVLFRKGDKSGAHTAYLNGIRAHMELMNEHLRTKKNTEISLAFGPSIRKVKNLGVTPITEEEINNYLKSKAVAQSSGELELSDIMLQKMIACSFSQVVWNDMRRYNFSAGNIGSFGVVYPGFERPYEYYNGGASPDAQRRFPDKTNKTNEDGYWFRRFMQASYETDYNAESLKAINPRYASDDIYSMPVWWDIEE